LLFIARGVVDQQREATADLQLAVDFLRLEFADQFGANYTELNSIPLLLTHLRRAKHRPGDPAYPEVLSPYPPGAAPVASSVESTPTLRRRQRRRRRRDGLQQDHTVAVTSVPIAAPPDSFHLEKPTPIDHDHVPTSEAARRATIQSKSDGTEDELLGKRADYAKRLLRIAHGLHYGSIAILGVFVIQVYESIIIYHHHYLSYLICISIWFLRRMMKMSLRVR